MKNNLTLIIFILLSISTFAQIEDPILITQINSTTEETSGLIIHNNELWTHNDSGGEPILYSIDTTNGNIIRSVVINNATNIDWEDICLDDSFAYIGDFGNNSGARDDLKIYRINLADLSNPELDNINSETIYFTYDPSIYSAVFTHRNNTNFDCEAMIAFEDSLYLFSKNWIDKKTYLYALPKEPGSYTANLKDTLISNGLVCGADYCPKTNTIALIGYVYGIPAPSIFILLSDFENDNFFSGTVFRKELNLNGCQTEGIVFNAKDNLWISNEKFLSYNPSIFSIHLITNKINDLNTSSLFCDIYPNPANNEIQINFPCNKRKCKASLKIINNKGQIILDKNIFINSENISKKINVSNLQSGHYIVQIYDKEIYFQTSFIKK